MLGAAQECFSGRLGGEYARLSFNAEIDLEAAGACDEANNRFGKVDIEIVANDVPLCGGNGTAEQATKKAREVLFRPGVADNALDFASADVESGDQGLGAVALIFKLASLDFARHH